MRLGAWLCASLALLNGACSGDYPLAPTPCDDWCDATQGTWGFSCGDYSPAGCVSDCEAQNLSGQSCRPAFDAALTCYQATSVVNSDQCYYDPNVRRPCQTEVETLLGCTSLYVQSFGPGR